MLGSRLIAVVCVRLRGWQGLACQTSTGDCPLERPTKIAFAALNSCILLCNHDADRS